ncbi:MAG TPA: ATPase [Salinivirgaceae bacterium]|nr:ATPase [Salinivirgaceae bacterium]
MKTPFTFGKIALDKDFTDRERETARLVQNYTSLTHTILISPRRWGKSSLVTKASKLSLEKNKKLRFCFIDLNNVRTEEQFYEYYTTEILKSSSTKLETIVDTAKKVLGRFIPTITVSPTPENNFQLGLNWSEVKKQPSDIIDMAERLAINNNTNYIICIDEFQNISQFENPEAFQKMLRAHWQKHQQVSYCLYGSKRHMLMDVFTSPTMPFYKFGDIIFLDKISTDDWVKFITGRFNETGKKIDVNAAKLIADLTERHSYYVQQLAQQSWLRTEVECTNEIVSEAFEDLILQLSMLFQSITDGLNNSQINLLKAVINNVEQLSSTAAIKEYHLGTSANVLKIKKALINKEIIDIQNDAVYFLDPLYKYWLKKYFFRI